MSRYELFPIERLEPVLGMICHSNNQLGLFSMLAAAVSPFMTYEDCVLLIPDNEEAYIAHSQSEQAFNHTVWPITGVLSQAK